MSRKGAKTQRRSAAQAVGSDFVLETACREAEAVLLDRLYFSLSAPANNPKLRRLLQTLQGPRIGAGPCAIRFLEAFRRWRLPVYGRFLFMRFPVRRNVSTR